MSRKQNLPSSRFPAKNAILAICLSLFSLQGTGALAAGIEQSSGEARNFLKNWYEKRVISADSYLDSKYQKLKQQYLEQAGRFPTVVETPDLPETVLGSYDHEGTIWVRESLSSREQIATVIHEGTHFFDFSAPGLNSEITHSNLTARNIIPFERKWTEKQKADYEYIGTGYEIHARIMTLRWRAGFLPDREVTREQLESFMKKAQEDGDLTPGSPNYDSDIYDLKQISRDPDALLNLLNLMV